MPEKYEFLKSEYNLYSDFKNICGFKYLCRCINHIISRRDGSKSGEKVSVILKVPGCRAVVFQQAEGSGLRLSGSDPSW